MIIINDSHPNPEDNWIIKCLKDNRLYVINEDSGSVIYDETSLNSLIGVLGAVNSGGTQTIQAPDCSIPIFQLASIALGYYLINIHDDGIVVAFSKDDSTKTFVKKIKVYSAFNVPISHYFPVAYMNRRFRNIDRIMQPRGALIHPMVVFSDTLDPIAINRMYDNGYYPKIFIIDGRLIGHIQFDRIRELMSKYTDSHFILISPSKYLEVPSFPEPQQLQGDRGVPINPEAVFPLLVNMKIDHIDLSASKVESVYDQCTRELINLKRVSEHVPDAFFKTSWALFRLLLSLPLTPSSLNRAWSYANEILEHPISTPLSRLQSMVDEAYCENAHSASFMMNCYLALKDLCDRLDLNNPKKKQLFDLLESDKKHMVIVNNRTTVKALQNILSDDGNKDNDIVHWYQIPTWAPTEREVIICCPPPPGREWITTVPVSSKVTFLFYPIEAALMRQRYLQIGLNRGKAWNLLEDIMRTQSSIKNSHVLIEDADLISIVDDISMIPPTDIRLKTRYSSSESDELVKVIPIILEEVGIYWARLGSKLAIVREGKQYRLKPQNVSVGDIIILPRHSHGSEIQEAIFEVVESKPGNRDIVLHVREWKQGLVTYIKSNNITLKELTKRLNENGANVSEHQLRSILGRFTDEEKQIATLDHEYLVKAALKLIKGHASANEVELITNAITRLRGIHQVAGKMLRKLAEASLMASDVEYTDIIDSELGLTLDDLRKQVLLGVVDEIQDTQEVPSALAGSLELTYEELDDV